MWFVVYVIDFYRYYAHQFRTISMPSCCASCRLQHISILSFCLLIWSRPTARYAVDLYFSSGVHAYERSFRVLNGSVCLKPSIGEQCSKGFLFFPLYLFIRRCGAGLCMYIIDVYVTPIHEISIAIFSSWIVPVSLCLASWLSVLRHHGGQCGMWVRQSLTVRSFSCHLMSCMTWYDMVALFQTGWQELQSMQTILWMSHPCYISSLDMNLDRSLLDHLRAETLHSIAHVWLKQLLPCELFPHIWLQFPNKHGEASTSCERWCRRSSSTATWSERFDCCGWIQQKYSAGFSSISSSYPASISVRLI